MNDLRLSTEHVGAVSSFMALWNSVYITGKALNISSVKVDSRDLIECSFKRPTTMR